MPRKPIDPRSIRDKHSRAVIYDRIGQDIKGVPGKVPSFTPGKTYVPSPDYAEGLKGNYGDWSTARSKRQDAHKARGIHVLGDK